MSYKRLHRSRYAPGELHWIPADSSVTVCGRALGGMIYLGDHDDAIDPRLPVAEMPSSSDPVSELPSYGNLSPPMRAQYLEWLQSGRQDPHAVPQLVLLYFYGLERHFFCAVARQSVKVGLLNEVSRLLRIYGQHIRLRRAFRAFIYAARAVLKVHHTNEPLLGGDRRVMELDTAAALGRQLRRGTLVSGDLAVRWYMAWHLTRARLGTTTRTVARHAGEELVALVRNHLRRDFPNGVPFTGPAEAMHATYTAASGSFAVPLGKALGSVPDIRSIATLPDPVRVLVAGAVRRLARRAAVVRRGPRARESVRAHLLLPKEIRTLFPSERLLALRQWAEHIIRSNSGMGQMHDAMRHLDTKHEHIYAGQILPFVARALEALSIGLIPDPRYSVRLPIGEDPLLLFHQPPNAPVKGGRQRGHVRLVGLMTLGTLMAYAGPEVAIRIRQVLQGRILESAASAFVKARLNAELRWMTAVPPAWMWIRRRVAMLSAADRQVLCDAVQALVVACDLLEREDEVKVRELVQSIGLECGAPAANGMHGAGFVSRARAAAVDPSAVTEILKRVFRSELQSAAEQQPRDPWLPEHERRKDAEDDGADMGSIELTSCRTNSQYFSLQDVRKELLPRLNPARSPDLHDLLILRPLRKKKAKRRYR